jgi:hypothetical protein
MDKTCEDWFDEIACELKHSNRKQYKRLRAAYNNLVAQANSARPGVLKALEHGEDILPLIKFGPVEDVVVLANLPPIQLAPTSAKPPSSYWLELLTPAALAQDFLANMEVLFAEKWVPLYGIRRAKLLWFSQCLQMVVGHWSTVALCLYEKLCLKR